MELNKHKNHRNLKYLSWLRTKSCIASGDKAQCAHHIRLGTNGGSSLKPSDYFCVPLTNDFHTMGASAIHRIGEESFFKLFLLKKEQLFIYFLREYLDEVHDVKLQVFNLDEFEAIAILIEKIESLRITKNVKKKKEKKKLDVPRLKVSLKGNEYYEQAKVEKRKRGS